MFRHLFEESCQNAVPIIKCLWISLINSIQFSDIITPKFMKFVFSGFIFAKKCMLEEIAQSFGNVISNQVHALIRAESSHLYIPFQIRAYAVHEDDVVVSLLCRNTPHIQQGLIYRLLFLNGVATFMLAD